MLRLQIEAPLDRKFETLAALLHDFYGLGVVQPLKWFVDHCLETGEHFAIDAIGKKLHVVGTTVQNFFENRFQ